MTMYQLNELIYISYIHTYHLHAKSNVVINDIANLAHHLESIPIARRRMGHINMRTLRRMHPKKTVDGLNLTDEIQLHKNPPICSGCPKGKMHRLSFSDGRRKTFIIGELIHSDVCGTMSHTSIEGECYFVIFKDDFSGFVAAYLIRKKSEVLSYYRLFAALVKTQTGCDILTLRTDRRGEYANNAFKTHLTEKGVKHEVS